MKAKNLFVSIILVLFFGSCIISEKVAAQDVSVSFQVFYDELSPYGTWVDNPDYGYVWYPDVAAGFSPYATNGYWVFTDEGWTWVSDYSWGWAPFHYGRWYIDVVYGPMWIPDNEWGPGWVTWRRSTGYYGWAPIGPGVSVNVAYGEGYKVRNDHWTFVRETNFGNVNINNYYIDNTNNAEIISNSTVINNSKIDRVRNVTYNTGPDKGEVEKFVGKSISPVAIKESKKPEQNLKGNKLQIYKPQLQKSNNNNIKSVPSRIEKLENVKTMDQRSDKDSDQKSNQQNNQNPSKFKNTNPSKQNNGNKQQKSNPDKYNNGTKQQQVNPDKKGKGNKQNQNQKVNPTKKEEGKKQQVNPSKKEEGKKKQEHDNSFNKE